MASYADLRRFGLALPEVIEHPHMDQPCLRVRGKMFVLWSEPHKNTIMKLDRAHQDMLFEVRPAIFTPCKVGTGVLSYVVLSKLTRIELKMLLHEAWSQVAPKRLREAISIAAVSPRHRRRSKPGVRKDI